VWFYPKDGAIKEPSTNDVFAATIFAASTKMLNRLYPAELEGHWRI
jgi:hypothetical protein